MKTTSACPGGTEGPARCACRLRFFSALVFPLPAPGVTRGQLAWPAVHTCCSSMDLWLLSAPRRSSGFCSLSGHVLVFSPLKASYAITKICSFGLSSVSVPGDRTLSDVSSGLGWASECSIFRLSLDAQLQYGKVLLGQGRQISNRAPRGQEPFSV